MSRLLPIKKTSIFPESFPFNSLLQRIGTLQKGNQQMIVTITHEKASIPSEKFLSSLLSQKLFSLLSFPVIFKAFF